MSLQIISALLLNFCHKKQETQKLFLSSKVFLLVIQDQTL